jgi:hypothetical protein
MGYYACFRLMLNMLEYLHVWELCVEIPDYDRVPILLCRPSRLQARDRCIEHLRSFFSRYFTTNELGITALFEVWGKVRSCGPIHIGIQVYTPRLGDSICQQRSHFCIYSSLILQARSLVLSSSLSPMSEIVPHGVYHGEISRACCFLRSRYGLSFHLFSF